MSSVVNTSRALAKIAPTAGVARSGDKLVENYFSWVRLLAPLVALEGRSLCKARRELALRAGVSTKTIQRKLDAHIAGNWLGVADKRLDSKTWRGCTSTGLTPDDKALWHRYVAKYRRDGGCRAAHRALLRDLARGADEHGALVACDAGYDPRYRHPAGFSYENLMREENMPRAFTLQVIRRGPRKAAKEAAQVLTTRVGLRLAQFYMFDDLWHDHRTSFRTQALRPLELDSLELFAAYKNRWGIRPRFLREDGTHDQIKEREALLLIAAVLRFDGYRTDDVGTTLILETGTTTIRDEKVEAMLADYWGIRIERGATRAPDGLLGQFSGRGKGNSNFKAALESLRNLIHNEMGYLPGQVGKDRDHTPEDDHGLVRYHDALMKVMAKLPAEVAREIQLPIHTFDRFVQIAGTVYDRINAREDHDLEGWRECGNVVLDYFCGGQWLRGEQFLQLPAPAQSAIAAACHQPGSVRERYLSPAQVWRRHSDELARIPASGVAALLCDEFGSEQKVDGGYFVFEDDDIRPGELRYSAEIVDDEGLRQILRSGEKFRVLVNPFAEGELYVHDAQGRFLGYSQAVQRACRGDVQAVQQQMGQARHQLSELMAEANQVTLDQARRQLGMHQRNAAVIENHLRPPAQRAHAAAVDRAAREGAEDLSADDATAALTRDQVPAPETASYDEIAGIFASERSQEDASGDPAF